MTSISSVTHNNAPIWMMDGKKFAKLELLQRKGIADIVMTPEERKREWGGNRGNPRDIVS